jgi:hypothetical protein
MTITIIPIDVTFNNRCIEQEAIRLQAEDRSSPKVNRCIEKIIAKSLKGMGLSLDYTPEFIEGFELTFWKKKLNELLKMGILQNNLLALGASIPIRLYIRYESELPIAFVIAYGASCQAMDLQEMADEVNRIKKFKLHYVYERDRVEADFFATVAALKNSSLIKERLKSIEAFNKRWDGQLSFNSVGRSGGVRGDWVTYTITDVSGEVVESTTYYPVAISTDLDAFLSAENPKDLLTRVKSRCGFFNHAIAPKACAAVAASAVLTAGMYILGNS